LQPNGNGGEFTQYHHPDRLGTRLITNSVDTTVQEQVELPYGTALDAESTGSTNRRFTSYDRSASTGLDYAVNRHYDSQQGRFTQVDPIGMSAASLNNPQTLNLYAYCGNDPVNHLDLNGLFWGKLFRGIGKVVATVLKWGAAAAGVFVAFVAIATGHPEFLIISGLLFGFAFGGATVQRILGAAGAAASIYQQIPGIIQNLTTGRATIGAARLSPWWSTVGAIVSFLQQNPAPTPQQQPKKPPCKQSPNGGDVPEILKYLSTFGLMDLIDPQTIRHSVNLKTGGVGEGIQFQLINRADAVTALSGNPHFGKAHLGFEHNGQVGGKNIDFRGYTDARGSGATKSLQFDIGPAGKFPVPLNVLWATQTLIVIDPVKALAQLFDTSSSSLA
jgi:RHS repeat-associated protein